MPNWCYNTLTVTGNKKDVQRFRKLAESKESALDFNKLFPMPKALEGTTSPARIVSEEDYEKEVAKAKEESAKNPNLGLYLPITQKMSDVLKKKYGTDNWYDWHVENWGTKWGADEVDLSDDDGDYLQYSFQTAWSPPVSFFERVSKDFPKLNFRLKYDEEGEQYFGRAKIKNGEVDDQCIED